MKGPKDILFLFQAPCHRIWVYIHGELYKAFCSQIALKVRPTPLYLSLSGLPVLAWSACPSVRPPLHSEVYRLQDEQFQWFQCRDQSQRKEQTEGEDKRRERDRERERETKKEEERTKEGWSECKAWPFAKLWDHCFQALSIVTPCQLGTCPPEHRHIHATCSTFSSQCGSPTHISSVLRTASRWNMEKYGGSIFVEFIWLLPLTYRLSCEVRSTFHGISAAVPILEVELELPKIWRSELDYYENDLRLPKLGPLLEPYFSQRRIPRFCCRIYFTTSVTVWFHVLDTYRKARRLWHSNDHVHAGAVFVCKICKQNLHFLDISWHWVYNVYMYSWISWCCFTFLLHLRAPTWQAVLCGLGAACSYWWAPQCDSKISKHGADACRLVLWRKCSGFWMKVMSTTWRSGLPSDFSFSRWITMVEGRDVYWAGLECFWDCWRMVSMMVNSQVHFWHSWNNLVAMVPWCPLSVAGPVPVGPDHWHPQPQCPVRGWYVHKTIKKSQENDLQKIKCCLGRSSLWMKTCEIGNWLALKMWRVKVLRKWMKSKRAKSALALHHPPHHPRPASLRKWTPCSECDGCSGVKRTFTEFVAWY